MDRRAYGTRQSTKLNVVIQHTYLGGIEEGG